MPRTTVPSPVVTVTYYLEILSSWCHWAEPGWNEVRARYGEQVRCQWRIALMNPADFPLSREQCDWFYRRSGTLVRSPYMLHSGWLETTRAGNYEAPNLVAEAARNFLKDPEDDRVRLALTEAGLRRGERIGNLATAVRIAAKSARLDATQLGRAARSAAIRTRVDASTAAFHAHQINQRPAFVIESAIGDKAVFSGVCRAAPLSAAIDGMLADAAGYAAHAAHFPPLPRA